jgi:hypothetical protein
VSMYEIDSSIDSLHPNIFRDHLVILDIIAPASLAKVGGLVEVFAFACAYLEASTWTLVERLVG